ncbi:exosome complex protein Rrp42 [Thermogladius sp. 4427co]|uniref:exosome complex protein Rrp42 n=1 Tax=Thermogladius sp. 4427co TaxID=3450718 RepID=UPI003F7A4EF4
MSITPSREPILPKLKAETILKLLKRGERIDNRGLLDYRDISVRIGLIEKAEGSALVRLGGTQIIAGVKTEIGSPFEDRPDEGVLQVHAEFVPLASPSFEPGPPNEDAIEVARVIDRSLREPKAIDLSKLVIQPGRTAWVIYNDIYVIDHDGNILDAGMIASMIALATAKLPKLEVSPEGFKIVRNTRENPIPVNLLVATVTMGILDNIIIVDPSLEEESVINTYLTISVDEKGRIVGIQKRGSQSISFKTLDTAIEVALKKGGQIINLIRSIINNPQEYMK